MEELKQMKECLIKEVQGQIYGNMKDVDAKELGEAVDMIKDLAEAIYYCTITEAMEKKDGEEENNKYYYNSYIYPERWDNLDPMKNREIERRMGRMYYEGDRQGRSGSNGGAQSNPGSLNGGRGYYNEYEYPMREMMPRDPREGRAYRSRKTYMESKEMNHGQEKKMQELEEYMKELSTDITEMIEGASPDEKALLQQKLSTLVSKIK